MGHVQIRSVEPADLSIFEEDAPAGTDRIRYRELPEWQVVPRCPAVACPGEQEIGRLPLRGGPECPSVEGIHKRQLLDLEGNLGHGCSSREVGGRLARIKVDGKPGGIRQFSYPKAGAVCQADAEGPDTLKRAEEPDFLELGQVCRHCRSDADEVGSVDARFRGDCRRRWGALRAEDDREPCRALQRDRLPARVLEELRCRPLFESICRNCRAIELEGKALVTAMNRCASFGGH